MRTLLLTLTTCLLVLPAQAKYSGGSGTAQDPYQIATAADLIALGESPADYDKHFLLTADIDLDPNLPGRKVFDKAVIGPDWQIPFTGVFDGNGHTISHLTIKGGGYLGLFGWLKSGAEARNIEVVNVNIAGSGDCVGGLVGYNWGRVIQCYSTGRVSGNSSVGGLVGGNSYAALTQCYSTGSVIGLNVVGGLVGYNYCEVTQCYSTGAVRGKDHVGGLVGFNYRPPPPYTRPVGYVYSCFWDTQTSGQIMSAGGTGMTTAQMQDPRTFIAAGWDFVGQPDGPDDIWAEPAGGGYPVLWWQLPAGFELPQFSGGTGGPNDPYLVSTEEELNRIGNNPRLMRCHFELAADLDLAGSPSHMIGVYYPYEGVFDGNGKTIRNLSCILFLSVKGLIKDLRLVDPNCIDSPVRFNYGTITSCSVEGGTVSGSGGLGGLVGCNSGTVTRCYSSARVSGGYYETGGLVSGNFGHVIQCYSTGGVSASGPYSSVGGLVGKNYEGTVTACFWDTQTSGQAVSAGGTGKTTAQMQTGKTFLDAGWDFVGETKNGTEDIWWILEGKDYPHLWWEAQN